MESKVEILSKEMVKPSSPTPTHLRDFKISLLDEMVPPTYVPIILFYCAGTDGAQDFEVISNKLKFSLSKILNLYYPFCGRLKATSSSSVDCNDEGVLYIESKIPTNLSDTLKLSQSQIKELLLPFDPYDVPSTMDNYDRSMVNMAVQLSEFRCGGIALGVCLAHKLADAAATASFLNSWAEATRDIDNGGNGSIVEPPRMDASLIFPPRGIELAINELMVVGGSGGGAHDEKLVTKCFLFNATNLSSLKARFGDFNATGVEAITALIWRSAIQAAKAATAGGGESKTTLKPSLVCHAVDIRNRMVPSLPKTLFGNLCLYSFTDLVESDGIYGSEELDDLVEIVRNGIKEAIANYSGLLQGDGSLDELVEFFKEARSMFADNFVTCYGFTSWTRFGFYEVDFGWGKPSKVRHISHPLKNVVYLMPTRTGDEIEAWISMTEHEMVQFQRNPELLQYASLEF
ncbi:hypothetical protein PIB30_070025 [Stylosanthes scabra]|uniref:Uncharacterized protein n=1 Tax=Stylosanthes scabra TaxID=79078 RepID=A0ABU6XLP2_9FABA|nr:hypothetical protein [Stylosanthes scabra]